MNSWTGDFLPESRLIIQQHVAHCNISRVDEYLNKWIEFINVHLLCPVIHFKVFSDVLDNLMNALTTGQLSSHEVDIFLLYSVQYHDVFKTMNIRLTFNSGVSWFFITGVKNVSKQFLFIVSVINILF